jgi:ribose transport system substrate-binding protein
MSDKTVQSRRDLLKLASVAGAAGLLSPSLAALAKEAGRSEKPLKAAFSNAGLQATWCAQGKQAAEYWGKLFNVEVTWFDGQLDAVKQRAAIVGFSLSFSLFIISLKMGTGLLESFFGF